MTTSNETRALIYSLGHQFGDEDDKHAFTPQGWEAIDTIARLLADMSAKFYEIRERWYRPSPGDDEI